MRTGVSASKVAYTHGYQQEASVSCWLEASVPHHRGLFIGLLECPYDIAVGFSQGKWPEREKLQGVSKSLWQLKLLCGFIIIGKGNPKSWDLCFVHGFDFRDPLECLCVVRTISFDLVFYNFYNWVVEWLLQLRLEVEDLQHELAWELEQVLQLTALWLVCTFSNAGRAL